MKKLYIMKTMLLLFALVVGSSSVWATEEVYYTLDGTDTSGGNSNYAEDGGGLTQDGISWSVTGNTTINPWRIGGKVSSGTSAVDREIYSKTAMTSAITKVELVIGDINLSSVNSITLIVASNSNFSTVIDEITKSPVKPATSIAANQTLTFQPTSPATEWVSGAYYKFVLNVTLGTSNKYIQVKSAKFYHETSGGGASTVATPTFNKGTGTYTTAQSVTLGCETDGSTIHYTMTEDGSTPADPTESDATYSSAISVTKSGTKIKAKAFKSEMTASSVATATYTIKPNAPTITGGANVTITGDDGLTFYYTTNGSAPTNESAEYTGAFTPGDCTVKAIAYDAYGNSSAVATLNYKYMPLAPKNIGSGYFVKVTDAGDLENGDAILIVNDTYEKALGTTQNTSNRSETGIEFISDGIVYAPSADVQKLVLVKKNETISSVATDVFYFYTGSDGYLYAPSSSSNQLKTEAAPDDNNNARATIAISSGDGDATITFKGTATRNLLKYNSGSSIFSCYSSGQTAVQIYKEVAHNESATISAAKYATYCSPYALDFSGVSGLKAYRAYKDGTSIKFEEVDEVPAGEGVLLKGEENTYNVPVIASASAITNEFVGVTTETTIPYASASDAIFVLKNGASGVGFYKTTKAFTVRANSAYLPSSVAAGRSFIGFEDETTGISEERRMETTAPAYNLQGQRVNANHKGLVIKNGKKVVIK